MSRLNDELMSGVVERQKRTPKPAWFDRHPWRATILMILLIFALVGMARCMGWTDEAKAAEPAPGVVPPDDVSVLDPSLSIPFQMCALGGMVVRPWGVTEKDGMLTVQCIPLGELQGTRIEPPEDWEPPSPAVMEATCQRTTGKPLAPVDPGPDNYQRRFWWLGFGLFWCGEHSDVRFDRAPRRQGA